MSRLILLASTAALAGVLAGGPAARADAGAALTTRASMLALDARCGVLPPDVARAIDAGRRQAWGVLARAGAADADLDRLERVAADAVGELSCEGPRAQELAGQAIDAYRGWRAIAAMEFPAAHRSWSARRARFERPHWLVRQDAPWGADGRARFGLLADSDDGGEVLSVYLDGGSGPVRAVRLRLRDRDRSPRRLPPEVARMVHPPADDPLVYATAPMALTTSFWASARGDSGLIERLEPDTAGSHAAVFSFPAEAIAAIEALDPREALVIEIDVREGRATRRERALIEVGDFAPARAFAVPSAPGEHASTGGVSGAGSASDGP